MFYIRIILTVTVLIKEKHHKENFHGIMKVKKKKMISLDKIITQQFDI